MPTTQGNRFAALRGVDGFVDTHASKLPITAASAARTKLKADIVALESHFGSQNENARRAQSLTGGLQAARAALLDDHMRPISRVAAAERSEIPNLEGFRMPRTNASHAAVIQAAAGMASLAEEHAAAFQSAGLPADFAQSLRQAAEALQAGLDARAAARSTSAGARINVGKTLATARKQVNALDALVRVDLKNDPLLAQWASVKRVAQKAVQPTSVEPAATPVPVTAPVTAPTSPQPAAA